MSYIGWAFIGLFLIVHLGIHRFVHRWLCVNESGEFLDIPFPLWVHAIIMWPALLVTIVIVWLLGVLL